MKIKLTIFCLLISVASVVAQDRIALNSKISFNMPDGTVKFEDTDHVTNLKEAFGDKIAQTLTRNTTAFRYKHMIFRFREVENTPTNFIQNSDKALDDVYGKRTQTIAKSKEKLYKGYSKKLKKLNNGQVVYAFFQEEKKSVLNFSYYNSDKHSAFGGKIIYDANDQDEVKQVFDKLCKSIVINSVSDVYMLL